MKKIVNIISVALVVVMALIGLSSCGEKAITDLPETTDNYRSYYQIFPYSFADSDGDGIGDINGIIAKLDYIANMNFEGIWLTPVHQSPSYHKYDVVDYKSIDKKFGTLEDYDRLVEECHKRGMSVLLDLVFNHTSDQNDWFEACYLARSRGETWDKYYDFYNFEQSSSERVGWSHYNGSWIYESQFNAGMPDLNLQNVLDEPEGYLATELKDIMSFWLVDHDVDGFRLDAVTSYFTGNRPKNTQFLSWLNSTAKSLKPDCYIVGEGAWSGTAENAAYQTSGVDSIFMFQHGYTATNSLSFAVRLEKASYLASIDQSNIDFVSGGIPAMFIANHDIARAYGIMQGGSDINNIKMGFGLMSMCAGTTFWYYGDEIAMRTFTNAAGKDIDENKRQPIPWGDNYTCIPVKGTTSVPFDTKYPLGMVKDNLKDKSSIIAYITRANALRRAFPQIARNYGEQVYLSDDGKLGVVKKGEGSDTIYIVTNLSHSYNKTLDVSTLGGNFKLVGTLSVDKMPTLKGGKLTMPVQTFAILQQV